MLPLLSYISFPEFDEKINHILLTLFIGVLP